MKWEKLVGGWKAAHGWVFFVCLYIQGKRVKPCLTKQQPSSLLRETGNLFSILLHLCFPSLHAVPFPVTWILLQY